MKKVVLFLLTLSLLIGGLIFAVNISQQQQPEVEPAQAELTLNPNLPPLHYFRQDRYPTAEELPYFHIFKGQFPLENTEGKIELHNFNE